MAGVLLGCSAKRQNAEIGLAQASVGETASDVALGLILIERREGIQLLKLAPMVAKAPRHGDKCLARMEESR